MNDIIKFWGSVIIITVILVIITICLMKKFKHKPIRKYIPGLMIWFVSIILLIIAIFFSKPIEDLGYFIMSMITGLICLIVIIITVLFDYITKQKTKK